MSEVNAEFIVTIHDLSRGGSGVARLESGEVVFVPYTAPGDEVRIKIIERKKNYVQGEWVELIRPSALRATPLCPVFQKCGGCTWQHLPYELQFETKKKGLLHALKRGGIDPESLPLDSMPAASPYHYRNRVQLRGSIPDQAMGFFERGTHKVVNIESCAIADHRINEVLPKVRETGFQQSTRDFKVEIGLDEKDEVQISWNKPHASFGFRQVNDKQNTVLQKWVSAQLRDANILLDLYGGDGNLSRDLKGRFQTIHCVDVRVPNCPLDPAYQYHQAATSNWIDRFSETADLSKSHSVILDPPREGLSQDFQRIADALKQLKIESIVLVSCDVDSFVRDTTRLLAQGYKLKRLGVLDLFPQTQHVESLALFTQ